MSLPVEEKDTRAQPWLALVVAGGLKDAPEIPQPRDMTQETPTTTVRLDMESHGGFKGKGGGGH